MEVFAGARYCKFNGDDNDFQSQCLQSFFQYDFGKRINQKHKEIGYSARIAYTQFDCKEIYRNSNRDIIFTNFSTFNFEQLLFFRFGGEFFKIVMRWGFNLAFPLSSKSLITTRGIERNYTLGHTSIGLSYRFGIKTKTKIQ